jgi:hypothetical protein
MHICSEGWQFDSALNEVRVIGGGEISARVISPKPEGTPPLPEGEWPTRDQLKGGKGWRALK